MKKCPYCAEDIQDAAVKCKHCGEFLDLAAGPRPPANATKWYFRTTFIVIAVLCVGPLALPLVWWRPQTARAWKIGVTVAVLLLTWLSFAATVALYRALEEAIRQLQGM